MIDRPEQHTILVSGATGQQGGAVARHLLKRGFRVRALTRDPEQEAARKLAEGGAEVVKGDFLDRPSLDRALDGAYGAFSVQNFWKTGAAGEIRQGKAFADAARDAGVEHFVYTSVGSAHRDTGIVHFESKWEIEEYIRDLDLPATILRPVFFMENWDGFKDAIQSGTLALPLSPDTTLQQIAVDDVGAFAAIAFSNPDEWIGREIELAGDEPSMRETVAVFTRVTGHEVRYERMPWEDYERQMGEEWTVMLRWFEEVGYEADIEALREMHPELKRLEPFLREHGWAHERAGA